MKVENHDHLGSLTVMIVTGSKVDGLLEQENNCYRQYSWKKESVEVLLSGMVLFFLRSRKLSRNVLLCSYYRKCQTFSELEKGCFTLSLYHEKDTLNSLHTLDPRYEFDLDLEQRMERVWLGSSFVAMTHVPFLPHVEKAAAAAHA